MMFKNEHEILINCPTERVFRFVSDFDTWRQWHPGLQEAQKTTSGAVKVGTTWNLAGQVRGQSLMMTIELTEYEPNRQFGFKSTMGPIDARQLFVFEPVHGGTRLNVVLELKDAELARAAWQQWESDLFTLKEILEFMA
jgi:uncharacterized protein YndB with AHSA1/START domain